MSEKGQEADLGQPFEKGGDRDLSEGPLKKRWCTDVFCIPIFIAHAVAFWMVTFAGFSDGDPVKLVAPRDYRGDYCGVKENWNSGLDLEKFEYQIWVMNLTSTFDDVAKGLVCTDAGKLVTRGGITANCQTCLQSDAEFEAYCGMTLSSAANDPAALANSVASAISNTFEQYTDPSRAIDLFTGSGGTDLMGQATKYFTMSCVKSCNLNQDSATSASPYIYEPDPLTYWGSNASKRARDLWTIFVDQINAASSEYQTLKDQLAKLQFDTWSTDDCPYTDRRFCVPMPGVSFEEFGSFGQCMPRMSPGVVDAIGEAASAALNGIAQLDITEDIGEHTKSFGNAVGDTFKAWDVLIIVGVCSFAIAFVALVLMRFVLGPIVWLSLLLILLLIAVGGFAIMMRANQCADDSFMDAADAQSSSFTAVTSGNNPFEQECVGGYSIEDETWRDLVRICGYIVLGIAALWLLVVACMSCRIQLAININKCAAQFMYNNPHVLIVPIVQAIVFLAWGILWIFCAAFLLSQVTSDSAPTGSYATYQEAEDACVTGWPSGGIWKDGESADCQNDLKCWRCMPSRWLLDWRFAYSFFSFVWHNYFMLAILQTVIAGTVGYWFFQGGRGSCSSVCVSAKNALLWHSGSLAFGSLIIAIIVSIKWFLRWLKKQSDKKDPSGVVKCIVNCLMCFVMCFERCIKFINKNAYIQIALLGNNFCKSAGQAWSLIARNFARFGVLLALSYMVHFIMYTIIIAGTTVAGYFILQAMYEDIDPVVPTIFYGIIGFCMSKLFIGTFALAVDTTLQCFIIAEEMKQPDLVPSVLKSFVDNNQGAKEGGWGSTYMNCCCF